MRLSLSVLLVTLALCCYEANANVCPTLVTEMRSSVLAPKMVHEDLLHRLHIPESAIKARMELKACTDKIPYEKLLKIILVMEKVYQACN